MSDPGPEDAGSCLVRDDPDGFLLTVTVGDISEGGARAIADGCQRLMDSGREVLVLSDARRTGTILPAARKAMADGLRDVRFDAIAIFGASFPLRVVSTLAAKTVQILTGQSYPVEFFATEVEARAWLLARRDALRAGRRPVA